jgi:hypothetical protein
MKSSAKEDFMNGSITILILYQWKGPNNRWKFGIVFYHI